MLLKAVWTTPSAAAGPGPQAGEVFYGAPVHSGAGGRHRRGGLRPCQAGDLVPGADELADEADPMKPLAPATNTRMM